MNKQSKILDTFQIVGFVFSIAISLGLLFAKQDTIPSVSLGLALAILTQLFDLQLRHSASEERLLQASVLSQVLYRDEWLMKQIRQIVDDYSAIKAGWYQLFKRRADDIVSECQNTLHSLMEGHMTVGTQTAFSFGADELRSIQKSLKSSWTTNIGSYWRSPFAEQYYQESINAVQRGVSMTRVFILKSDMVNDLKDIFERQRKIGIDVRIAFVDNLPMDLNEDCEIADDHIYARIELTSDGHVKGQRISIDESEVLRMVKKFDALLRHARKLEDLESKN